MVRFIPQTTDAGRDGRKAASLPLTARIVWGFWRKLPPPHSACPGNRALGLGFRANSGVYPDSTYGGRYGRKPWTRF